MLTRKRGQWKRFAWASTGILGVIMFVSIVQAQQNTDRSANSEFEEGAGRSVQSPANVSDRLNLVKEGQSLIAQELKTVAMLKMERAGTHIPANWLKAGDIQPNTLWYVLQVDGESDIVFRRGLHQYKGRTWNKNVEARLLADGIQYRAGAAREVGILVREDFSDVEDCIGTGTRIRLWQDEWVPIYNIKYRGGGFIVMSKGFKFQKGTEALIDGEVWRFDGKTWTLAKP